MNIEHKLHLCWRPVSDNIRNTIKMELPYRDLMFGVWKSHIKSLNFSSYFLYKFLNNFYNFINISALQFILHNTILLYHFRRAFYNCTWCAVNHITHTPSARAQYAHMYAWKYCIYYVAIPFCDAFTVHVHRVVVVLAVAAATYHSLNERLPEPFSLIVG